MDLESLKKNQNESKMTMEIKDKMLQILRIPSLMDFNMETQMVKG